MKILRWISSKRDLLRGITLIAFLIGVAYQVIHWQGFAFQVSYLQFRQVTAGLDGQNLKDYGAICNTLKNWNCSEKIFGTLVRRFPGSELGLANYGIALGEQGKWQRSAIVFERYFKRRGQSFDAMLWYAKALNQLLQPEKALQWYYRSLSVNSTNSEVATTLVDQLVVMGRFEEALSVIASFNRGVPEENPFWKTKITGIKSFLAAKGNSAEQELKTRVRLPAIVGNSHFVPVKAGTESGFQFFLIDQRQEDITMTVDVLAMLMHSGSAKSKINLGEAIKNGKIHLDQLELGPWALEDIDVILCKKCQSRIGNSILRHVSMEVHREDATEFLLLSLR